MKKFLLILLIFPFTLMAQDFEKKIWSIESFSMLESRSLLNDFSLDFYTGEFLDSTSKLVALDNLNAKNNIGYHTINSFQFGYIKTEKKIGPYISASHQKMMGIEFSKDLFELAFVGNESFSGRDIDLTPTNLQLNEFIDIRGGILWKLNDKLTINASAGPAFGLNYQNISSTQLQMYTSEITDSIALDYNLSYSRTPSYPIINGFGFSSEIGAEGVFSGIQWQASVSNLGVIWYNDRSVNTKKDSLIEFDGFELNELSDISSDIDNEIQRIENAFSLAGDTAKIKCNLPFKANISLQKEFQAFRLDISALYIDVPGFIPYVSLSPSKKVYKSIAISLPLKYGGFGGFNAGLGIEGVLKDNIHFKISSPALLSALGVNKVLSYGVYAGIYFKFSKNESSF